MPGLRPQHMTGITLLGEMCQGKIEGVQVGSNEVRLFPSAITGGDYVADTKTAGYVQAALICLFPWPWAGN